MISTVLQFILNHKLISGGSVLAIVIGALVIYFLIHRSSKSSKSKTSTAKTSRKAIKAQAANDAQFHHARRMSVLLKSLSYAGVPPHLLTAAQPQPQPKKTNHFSHALLWLFGAIGLSGAIFLFQKFSPNFGPLTLIQSVLAGVFPGAVALGHTLLGIFKRGKQTGALPQAAPRTVVQH